MSIQITAKDTASKAFKDASKSAGGFGKALTDVGKIAAGFLAANVIGAGVSKLTGFMGESTAAFKESRMAAAQLDAVLKSTGNVAGVTADELKKMASALEKTSLFEDEAIIGAQSLLLTFTNIGGKVIPDATQAVIDMSQALGQDLKSSSIQLGKALNDPIKGVTALSKAGVSFTAQQKEQIKAMVAAGNTAGAQALILKELSTEFGGSAKAASDAAGASERMKDRMNELKEEIGEKLLPIQEKWQQLQLAAVNLIASKVLPALSQVSAFVSSSLVPGISSLAEGFKGLPAPIQAIISPAATLAANFAAIKAAVEPLVRLFQLGFNGGQIGGELSTIHTAAFQVGNFFREVIVPAFNAAANAIHLFFLALQGGSAGGELTTLQQKALALGAAVRLMWEQDIQPAMRAFADIVVTTVKAINDNWGTIGPILATAVQMVITHIEVMLKATGGVVTMISGVVETVKNLIHGDWAEAWDSAGTVVEGAFKLIVGLIDGFTGGAASMLYNAGWDIIEGLWDGLKNRWVAVKNWFSGAVKSIPDTVLKIMGITSPSKVMHELGENTMQGYLNGLMSKYGSVQSIFENLGEITGAGVTESQLMRRFAPYGLHEDLSAITAEQRKSIDSYNKLNGAQSIYSSTVGAASTAAQSFGNTMTSVAAQVVDFWSAQAQYARAYPNGASSGGAAGGSLGGGAPTVGGFYGGGQSAPVGPITPGHSNIAQRGATINVYVQGSIRSDRELAGVIMEQIGGGGLRGAFA